MPTYEYKCAACGHAFEQFQSITAEPIKKCPACGKNKVRRLIGTGAGLIFKGSGFYITDYRDSGYQEKAKAESGASTSTSGSDGKETKAGGDSSAAAASAASSTSSAGESKSSKPAATTTPAKSKSSDPKKK